MKTPAELPEDLVWLVEQLDRLNRVGVSEFEVWQWADQIFSAMCSAREEADDRGRYVSPKMELRRLARTCRTAERAGRRIRVLRGAAALSRYTFAVLCLEADKRRLGDGWLASAAILTDLADAALLDSRLNGRPSKPAHDGAVESLVAAYQCLTGTAGRSAGVDQVTYDRKNARHSFVMAVGERFAVKLVTARSDHRMRARKLER